MDEASCVEAVRRFSRFYTRQVGVLPRPSVDEGGSATSTVMVRTGPVEATSMRLLPVTLVSR